METPCVQCGRPLPGSAQFCTACGAPAERSSHDGPSGEGDPLDSLDAVLRSADAGGPREPLRPRPLRPGSTRPDPPRDVPEPPRPDAAPTRPPVIRDSGRRSGIAMLPDETLLASASGSGYEVALTDRRVVSRGDSLGSSAEHSIPLVHVDSVFVGKDRKTWLLVLGVLVLIGAGYASQIALFVVALVLLGLWWFLARAGAHIISASGRTTIHLSAGATGLSAVTDFAAAVSSELARRDRARHP